MGTFTAYIHQYGKKNIESEPGLHGLYKKRSIQMVNFDRKV